MAIRRYLAMTAREFPQHLPAPWLPGWMACHFSPYDSGLTNLPQSLPEAALLILNDRIPPMNNDPKRVYQELAHILDSQKCAALLLDFQCPENDKTAAMAEELSRLPCPVAVSSAYGSCHDGPIFLPPVPVDQPLKEYLSPYKGREIWLELALDALNITVTKQGSHRSPTHPVNDQMPYRCSDLFCHYRMALSTDCAIFTLQRTKEDLAELLSEAEILGVSRAVGLWQELN